MSNDSSEDKSNDESSDRRAFAIGIIGLLALAVLVLPPLPPWLRAIAVVVVVLAVLGGLGILPRLRATWRRWLADLPSDNQRTTRWKRALGLIWILIVALLLLPPLSRFRFIAAVLAVFAIMGVLGAFPGLRATWRRWLSGLIVMFVTILVLSADGRLDMWLYGPAGDVNGALLADGTILRFFSPLADQLEGYLVPGQSVRADGWGMAIVYGPVRRGSNIQDSGGFADVALGC
jgi:hypothetical protein